MHNHSNSLPHIVKNYLQEDEQVLWMQIKSVNLVLKKIPLFVCSLLTIFCGVSLYLIIDIGKIFVILPLFLSYIICGLILILCSWGIAYTIQFTRKEMRVRRDKLNISDEELKNYSHYDIITNKRYIRRNYYEDERYDFSIVKSDAFNVINRNLFVTYVKVNKVIFSEVYRRVLFIIERVKEDQQNEYFQIALILNDIKDWEKIIEIFSRIIPKHKIFRDEGIYDLELKPL